MIFKRDIFRSWEPIGSCPVPESPRYWDDPEEVLGVEKDYRIQKDHLLEISVESLVH